MTFKGLLNKRISLNFQVIVKKKKKKKKKNQNLDNQQELSTSH